MDYDPSRAQEALTAYPFKKPHLEPITSGNINETYRVKDGPAQYILQRLNPIFKPEVHLDIDAITAHLEARGLITPRLLRTRAGTLWTEDSRGGVWRAMTFIGGVVHAHVSSPVLCQAAGMLLGRFHAALSDLEHEFKAARLGVHDTPKHLAGLEQALAAGPTHVAYAEVSAVAEAIFRAIRSLPSIHNLPARIVHGDPKVQNIIFAESGEGRAMIDLDTLARMALPLELGDAFRSWCNPGGENIEHAVFDMPRFEAGLRGYGAHARAFINKDEQEALPVAVETIALELAARFARDALEEKYFGWDKNRYSAAWQHHLARARGQLSLAQSYAAQRGDAERLVRGIFG